MGLVMDTDCRSGIGLIIIAKTEGLPTPFMPKGIDCFGFGLYLEEWIFKGFRGPEPLARLRAGSRHRILVRRFYGLRFFLRRNIYSCNGRRNGCIVLCPCIFRLAPFIQSFPVRRVFTVPHTALFDPDVLGLSCKARSGPAQKFAVFFDRIEQINIIRFYCISIRIRFPLWKLTASQIIGDLVLHRIKIGMHKRIQV